MTKQKSLSANDSLSFNPEIVWNVNVTAENATIISCTSTTTDTNAMNEFKNFEQLCELKLDKSALK